MGRLKRFFSNGTLAAYLAAAGVASFTVGCTRQIYVPVESVRIDTLYNARESVDSVIDRDSVYFAVKGDTVIREVYRMRTRTRLRVDTVCRVKSDTVRVTVKVPSDNQASGIRMSGFRHMLELLKWGCRIAMLAVVAYAGWKFYRHLKF